MTKDRKESSKRYRIKNVDKIKQWKLNHVEETKEYNKWYNRENVDKIKQLRIDNKDKLKEYNKQYQNNKKKIDIQYKIKCNLRTRIHSAIKGQYKTGSAVSDLGCTITEFKDYITKKFTVGMTWDNYGQWHLDHIMPLSCFNLEDRKQFLMACHYINYQPLWAIDNMKKGNKVWLVTSQ